MGDYSSRSCGFAEPFPSHAVAILADMIDSRLDARRIGFPAPRGAEASELNRLLARRTELVHED
jgi:hypothetical protein